MTAAPAVAPVPSSKPSLLSLAWPIFVEQGLRVLIGTVDTLMVSHLGDDAVAGLGVANQIVVLAIIVFAFVGIGSSVVITHHLGAGDRHGADGLARTAIAVNTWLGLGVSIAVSTLAAPLLGVLQLPDRLMPFALPFLTLMGGTVFLEAMNVSAAAVLRAHGHTRDAMLVTAGQNVLNVIGNSLLLFGLCGMPRLGVAGVAISGVVSRVVACVALRLLLRRRTGVRVRWRDHLDVPLERLRRILHIGLPAAGENISWWLGFMVVTTFTARMGGHELAVQSYVMQVATWVMLFGISIGLGTEILIGHLVGAGAYEDAYRELLRSLRFAFAIVIAGIIGVALVAPRLLGLFTHDPLIIASGAVLLRMGLFLEPGRVFNLVVINSLRATGDARFPVLMGMCSMWGVWVPLAWLLGLKLGLGLPGIWISMIADEWLRGLMMYRRWRARRWIAYATRSRAVALADAR